MNDHIELIDKYFENSLTPKEQKEFNELLQNDKKFKEEFVFQKDLKKVIVFDEQEKLKKELQALEEKITTKTRILPLYKKWLAAASIILLIGLGFWFVKDNYFPSNEQLYARNFEPYRNIVQPIVRGEKSNSLEYKAFVAYENGECYKALNLFNSLKNSNDQYVSFYKAMCYLKLDKTKEAINLLLPLSTSSENLDKERNFKEKAEWYLALAYLKAGDTQNAISQFSLVANHVENVFKKEESKRILNALN